MRLLLSFSFLALIFGCGLQKTSSTPFEGKIIYQLSSEMINPADPDSMNYQLVYAKDSMLRIENFTAIGKQIYIKHIPKNRAYILMDIHTKKVAIQTFPEDAPNKGKYQFKKAKGKSELFGQKVKSIKVELPDIDSVFVMKYFTEISPVYSEALPGIPGLPAEFTLFSGGIFIDYKVISLEQKEISIDLFGIPSDYEKMTMDQFIDFIQESEREN